MKLDRVNAAIAKRERKNVIRAHNARRSELGQEVSRLVAGA